MLSNFKKMKMAMSARKEFILYLKSELEITKQVKEENDIIIKSMDSNISLSREERRKIERQNKKNKSINLKNDIEISNLEKLINAFNTIKGGLDTDEEYERLLFAICCFKDAIKNSINIPECKKVYKNSIANIDNPAYFRSILSFFVLKDLNVLNKNNFSLYFDENGVLNPDNVVLFNSYLSEVFDNIRRKKNVTDYFKFEDFRNTFILEEELKKAKNDRNKQIILKQERKKKEKEAKKKVKQIKRLDNKKALEKETKLQEELPEIKQLYKYIDQTSHELRNDILETVSKKQLYNILSNNSNITKKMLNDYMDEYDSRLFNEKIKIIFTRLNDSDTTKLENFINDSENLTILKEFIVNKDINDENLKNIINFINENTEISEDVQDKNIIIFPNNDFFAQELKIIEDSKTHENKDQIKDRMMHHLKILKNQSLLELQQNTSDAFHEIKDGKNRQSFVYGDNLRGYRFGQKKSKVCFFKLSVDSNNKDLLKDIYSMEDLDNIILVFGLGDVKAEYEPDIYTRAIKNTIVYGKDIEKISKIFKEPFTEETLKEASIYIDSTIEDINNLNKEKSSVR